jgi:hypothetical protein
VAAIARLGSAGRFLLQEGDQGGERFGGGGERFNLLVGDLDEVGAERSARLGSVALQGGVPGLGQSDEDDASVVGVAVTVDQSSLLEPLNQQRDGGLGQLLQFRQLGDPPRPATERVEQTRLGA